MSANSSVNLIDLISEEVNVKTFKSTNLLKPLIQSQNTELASPGRNNPFDAELYKVKLINDPFELVVKKCNERTENKSELKSFNILADDRNEIQEEFSTTPQTICSPQILRSHTNIKQTPSNSNEFIFTNISSPVLQNTVISQNSFLLKNNTHDEQLSACMKHDKSSNSNEENFINSFNITEVSSAEHCEKYKNSPTIKCALNKPNSQYENDIRLDLSNNCTLLNAKSSETSNSDFLLKIKEEKILNRRRSKYLNDSFEDIMDTKPNWIESETEPNNNLEMSNISIQNKIELSQINRNKAVTRFKQIKENLNKYKKQINQEKQVPIINNMKEESNCNEELNGLTTCLKDVILECNEGAVKSSAPTLLEESLSSVLSSEKNVQPDFEQDPFEINERCNITSNNDINKSPVGNLPNVTNSDLSKVLNKIKDHVEMQNFNLIQTSADINSEPGKSTYIVVLGAQKPLQRQLTQIIENLNIEKEKKQSKLRRSLSLSNHDSRNIHSSQHTTKLTPKFTTPFKSHIYSPGITQTPKNKEIPIRKSFYTSPRITKGDRTSETRNILDDRKLLKKNIDTNFSKLKIKSTGAIKKTQGPIKANITIKKNTLPSNNTSTASYMNSKLRKCTPIIPVTPSKSIPVACSTPTISSISPKKHGDNKTLYVSTPVNRMKASNSYLKQRRSLANFETKEINSNFKNVSFSSKMDLPIRKISEINRVKNIGQLLNPPSTRNLYSFNRGDKENNKPVR